MSESKVIYHLATKRDFKSCFNNGLYEPLNFQADGFIHCSGKDSVIDVAEDYYSAVDDLILIKINCSLLKSELKFEDAAPIAGGGTEHLKNRILFPHIYGPINEQSIIGIGEMKKTNGRYAWPSEFLDLDNFL